MSHRPAPFKSKLIIKGLPPSITEEHARELLSDYTKDCFCINFVPGRPPNPHNPLHHIRPAALILDFKTEDALLNFTNKWQQVECKEGDRYYTTTIEFAPIQRHYKCDSLKARQKSDHSRHLLEQSKMYKEFLEEEFGRGDGEKTDLVTISDFMNPEKQSEALRAGEAKLKPWMVNPQLLKITPLLQHLEKKTSSKSEKNGGDSKKKKKSKKKKQQQPKDGDQSTDTKSKLPDGFYIDTNPSEVNVKEEPNARKGLNHSSKRTNRNKDVELKIYDLSIQDTIVNTKPRIRIASRPISHEPTALGPSLQQQGADGPPKRVFEPKKASKQSSADEQHVQTTGETKPVPSKKVFSLKELREKSTQGESANSGCQKKVFFLKDLKDNNPAQ